jgi:molecular chaperone GrpE
LRYGGERLIVQLLDVLDNFERALNAPVNPENINSFRQGVEMTAKEFRSALQNYGVKELEVEGKPFDPLVHEAISSQPSDTHAPDTILQVFRSGYTFHDKLIRPAQVVVATTPTT